MAQFVDRSFFNSYKSQKTNINESLATTRTFSAGGKIPSKVTVFLSHKHDDLDLLDGVIGFLKRNYNVELYIDSMDPSMPKTTSGETASRLKKVIKGAKKFILLATDAAIASKWCNWELGYGDACKFDTSSIAIFPILNDREDFKGNEYLELYPYIKKFGPGDTYKTGESITPGLYVCTNNNGSTTIEPLSQWLKNQH